MKTRINLNGLSTTSQYSEGDMYSLVNLRPKNGVLRPVTPREVINHLSQKYDIVFVHQGTGYKNWIGVVNGVNSATIYNDIRTTPTFIDSINEKVNSIEQIGSTLSVVTDSNIYYLFWQNGDYRFLGELPELPAISFKTSDEMAHAQMYFTNEYGQNGVKSDNFITATKGLVNKTIDILINGGIINGEYFEGTPFLFDAYYLRYAFRLYDGTLTKHSPPILIIPVRRVVGDEKIYKEGDDTYLGDDSIKYIEYRFSPDDTLTTGSYVSINGYKIYMWYDLGFGGDHSQWADIIKSVDIFMSAPLGLSNIENIRNDMPMRIEAQLLHRCNLIKGIHDTAAKNLRENSTFYFVKSLDLGAWRSVLSPEAFPDNDDDKYKVGGIMHQEVMKDDPFSHHKIGSGVTYQYNNRLHLGGIKTTFFNGFSTEFFQWGSKYNNVSPVSGGDYSAIISEVEINTGTNIEKVYSVYSTYLSVFNPFLSAFISYPDPRAQKITIYGVTGSTWKRLLQFNLTAHNLLNLSYHLQDNLNPIVASLGQDVPIPPVIGNKVSITEDKIKVSELNNPFLFPVENTYQAGTGSIIAMASNAIGISEGQFGQYPLYIFTTKGIYSLEVGTDIVYTKSSPTSYEIPTTGIVTPTPFGVAFTSQRGVCIIYGQEVTLLTPQLQDAPKNLIIEPYPFMEAVHNFQTDFTEHLKGIESMAYNANENELVICDKDSDFSYVLNLYSQMFYISTEKFNIVVKNTHPELYVVDDMDLKDYKQGLDTASVSFILRPMQFGEPYIKWLEKFLLFCTLYDVKPVYITHSSMDGINFKKMSGMAPSKQGNYSTLETRRIAGNKYRDFLFSFGASLSKESIISYLEAWIDKEYKEEQLK